MLSRSSYSEKVKELYRFIKKKKKHKRKKREREKSRGGRGTQEKNVNHTLFIRVL